MKTRGGWSETFEALVGSLLVRPHQARIARHIGGKDRGETADSGHYSPGATKLLTKFTPKLPKSSPLNAD